MGLFMAAVFILLSLFNGLLYLETGVLASFFAQIISFLVAIAEIIKYKDKMGGRNE
jgi:hypothetical protein